MRQTKTMPYCLKCKAPREMVDTHSAETKTGRRMTKGKCGTCGTSMSTFTKGKGLTLPGSGASGGAIPPQAAVGIAAGTLGILNAIGVMEPVKEILKSVGREIEYLITVPEAARYRNIYVERVPHLAKRWRDFGNDIEFLQRRKQQGPVTRRRISQLERKRADIVSLSIMLLEQAPRLMEIVKKKEEKIAQREASKLNKKINDLEAQLDTLKGAGPEKK